MRLEPSSCSPRPAGTGDESAAQAVILAIILVIWLLSLFRWGRTF